METIDIHFNPLSSASDRRFPDYRNILEELMSLLKREKAPEPELYERLLKATKAAANWELCACGNLCKAIPRNSNNEMYSAAPKDMKLYLLGFDFCNHMTSLYTGMNILRSIHDDINTSPEYRSDVFREAMVYAEQALETHLAIEERAGEILAEMFPTDEKWAEYVKSIEPSKP